MHRPELFRLNRPQISLRHLHAAVAQEPREHKQIPPIQEVLATKCMAELVDPSTHAFDTQPLAQASDGRLDVASMDGEQSLIRPALRMIGDPLVQDPSAFGSDGYVPLLAPLPFDEELVPLKIHIAYAEAGCFL
jgi:hypothetical protein